MLNKVPWLSNWFQSKSKSSNLSLYFSIFLLILLESTQVIRSSIFRVTKNAGSVMTSGPALTCPCSMKPFAYSYHSTISASFKTQNPRTRRDTDSTYRLHRVRHMEPRHHDAQPPTTHTADRDLLLHLAQLTSSASTSRA